MELKVVFEPKDMPYPKVSIKRNVEFHAEQVDEETFIDTYVHGFVYCNCGCVNYMGNGLERTCCGSHKDDMMDTSVDHVQEFMDTLYKYSKQIGKEFDIPFVYEHMRNLAFDPEFNKLKERKDEC